MKPRSDSIPDLGPLEFKLLRILWRKQPATAREVLDDYNIKARRALKYTTVMTLLSRMVEKGVLTVDRDRQPFQFVSKLGREQILKARLSEFVDLFFDGRPVELALRLVEDSDLSPESVKRLEEMLRKHRGDNSEKEEEK